MTHNKFSNGHNLSFTFILNSQQTQHAISGFTHKFLQSMRESNFIVDNLVDLWGFVLCEFSEFI